MLTVKQFCSKYNGKGIDFDGWFGFQCVDVIQQYSKECFGLTLPPGNAIDFYSKYWVRPTLWRNFRRYQNSPTAVPKVGDIVVWGNRVGPYGHIAIYSSGDVNKFKSFEQNWPIGSKCHYQDHSYYGVLGWLRKR